MPCFPTHCICQLHSLLLPQYALIDRRRPAPELGKVPKTPDRVPPRRFRAHPASLILRNPLRQMMLEFLIHFLRDARSAQQRPQPPVSIRLPAHVTLPVPPSVRSSPSTPPK